MLNNMLGILRKATPDNMKVTQEEDLDLNKVIRYVYLGKKQILSQIEKVKSKNVRKYLLQFNRLMFRNVILHQILMTRDVNIIN